jgi:phage terminase small subunit
MEGEFEDQFSHLSENERRFCEEYVIDCNAMGASRRAGLSISHSQAKRIVHAPHLAPYFAHLRSKSAELAGVTIIRNAKELANIAYPHTDDQGNEAYIAKPMDRMKAIELLNKMFAFNAPETSKVEVTNKSELDGKTDDELAAMIEEKRKQRQSLGE